MKDVLKAFGDYLEEQGMHFDVTIIGGAALLMMDVIDRATQDVDCLDPEIPKEIHAASIAFAKQNPELSLREDWLNNGPKDLRADLTDNWQERIVPLYSSAGIKVRTLGRGDLLKTKLFAYCDRQQDEQDCIALAPTGSELTKSLPWLLERDGNPYWDEHVKVSLKELAERLGYEFRS